MSTLPLEIRWRVGTLEWTEEEVVNLLLWASNSGCTIRNDMSDFMGKHLSYFRTGKQTPLQKRVTKHLLDKFWRGA